MTTSMSTLTGLWYSLENEGNPQVKDWFSMSSPAYPLTVVLIYVLFTTKIGPKYMENRKPFELKNTLIVYNLIQVVTCVYLVYQAIITGWQARYKLFCEPVNISTEPTAIWMTTLTWIYYILKFTELVETVFFILRKKFSQVTVLHVYHHSVMVLLSWGMVKFFSNGSMIFSGFLNSIVHIVMYMYYLLAACGPRVQKYLWWKKYITMLQLVQFAIVIIYLIPHYFIKDCDISLQMANVQILSVVIFIFLFGNFYRAEYTQRKRTITEDVHKVKSN